MMRLPGSSFPRFRHQLYSAGSRPDNTVPCSHTRTGIPRLPQPGSVAAGHSGRTPEDFQFPRSHMSRWGYLTVCHNPFHRSSQSMQAPPLPVCISQTPRLPENSRDSPLSTPADLSASRSQSPLFCLVRCLPSPGRFHPN